MARSDAATTGEQGLQPAMRTLVRDGLAKGEGATLTKNSSLRAEGGFSAGTIQRALDALAERGAMRVVSRGHLGRKVESIDVGVCWQAAGLPALRLVLSPAGAVEMDAIEAAIGDELTGLGIPHTVKHLRGGASRLQAVETGEQDLTVVSSGTLDGVRAAKGQRIGEPIRTLGQGTYYAPDRLVVVRRTQRPARNDSAVIAVDRASFDHEALTEAEFEPQQHHYVDVPFPDVPAYVLAGAADAGIWHITRSAIPPQLAGLEIVPLNRPDARAVGDRLSRAAIAGWQGRPEINAVLAALQLTDLETAQQHGFAEERKRERRLSGAQRSRGAAAGAR